MQLAKRPFDKRMSVPPGRFLVLGYLLLILAGTAFLLLPAATVSGSMSVLDALFTSASAVCVTGLAVVDTAGTFTVLGKTVILVLIQVGGLGIMVLSTLFLFSLGRKVSMTGRMLIHDTYSHDSGQNVKALLKDLLVFTLVIEGAGGLLLFARFIHQMPVEKAAFFALFHTVSAFCNAGFSLFSDSFCGYKNDALVNLTISGLIILGGIGFIVLSELKQSLFRSGRRIRALSLHTRLVLASTLLLLVISTGFVAFSEWDNVLAGQAFHHKLITAFFHAVNARTAGFNSVDIGSMTNGTLFFTIILMFIGTAPGSCGGGIKVTTFSAMVILGVSRLKGEPGPHIFYRRISEESISKALSVILTSIMIVVVMTLILLETEVQAVSHQLTRGAFLEVLFETVSAFGTVGLSTGMTPALSITGKLMLTLMMYIGRLGPLGVAMAVSRRKTARVQYAQENIMIG